MCGVTIDQVREVARATIQNARRIAEACRQIRMDEIDQHDNVVEIHNALRHAEDVVDEANKEDLFDEALVDELNELSMAIMRTRCKLRTLVDVSRDRRKMLRRVELMLGGQL